MVTGSKQQMSKLSTTERITLQQALCSSPPIPPPLNTLVPSFELHTPFNNSWSQGPPATSSPLSIFTPSRISSSFPNFYSQAWASSNRLAMVSYLIQFFFWVDTSFEMMAPMIHDVFIMLWNDANIKANSASGMAVNDECKLKFLELKTKRNFRFIIFKIDEQIQQVMVEKLGQPEENYDNFTASLPADECRYAVFDFDFTTDENCQKSKIFFISW